MKRVMLLVCICTLEILLAAGDLMYPGAGGRQLELRPPFDSKLERVSVVDRDYSSVAAEVAKLRDSYLASNFSKAPRSAGDGALLGPAIRKVFPGHRFYVVNWDECPRDKANPPAGLAVGLYVTLAIDAEGQVTRLVPYGNQGAFGQFLNCAGVVIRSEQEARGVWEAYCEVGRWIGKTGR